MQPFGLLTFYSKHNSVEIHLSGCMYQYVVSLYFHGMNASLFDHLPVEGHLGCCQFLAIMNKTLNIHVQVFV